MIEQKRIKSTVTSIKKFWIKGLYIFEKEYCLDFLNKHSLSKIKVNKHKKKGPINLNMLFLSFQHTTLRNIPKIRSCKIILYWLASSNDEKLQRKTIKMKKIEKKNRFNLKNEKIISKSFFFST